jgi:hypothetical protein
MTLSSSIQHAIAVSFSEQDQPAVITLLERLVSQWPGSVERTQAAILVLAYQDKMAVQDLIESSGGDSRDILQYIEHPNGYKPELTRQELVHRYRALGLTIPETLARVARKMHL